MSLLLHDKGPQGRLALPQPREATKRSCTCDRACPGTATLAAGSGAASLQKCEKEVAVISTTQAMGFRCSSSSQLRHCHRLQYYPIYSHLTFSIIFNIITSIINKWAPVVDYQSSRRNDPNQRLQGQ